MKKRKPLNLNSKIAAVLIAAVVLLVLLTLRIAYIQFVKGEEYSKDAYAQQYSGSTIPATRGTIWDADGNVLAVSVTAKQVTIDPTLIQQFDQVEQAIDGLARILNIDRATLRTKVTADSKYREVARKVENEIGEEVREWAKENNMKGIYVTDDIKRYYPNNNLACHVLGFTGRDDQGIVCGVEVAMNSYLQGTPGRVISAVDTRGNELPYSEQTRIEPQDGYNLKLTINSSIQKIVQTVMEETARKWGVEEGCCAIVMDPSNANILAMYSNPDFDLNNPYECPEGYDSEHWEGTNENDINILSTTVWRNKCLTDTYEPGSTFKTITAAIGLDNAVVDRNTMVNDANVYLGNWEISCSHGSHGIEPFHAAVTNSCNAVFARLGLTLGNEVFYNGLREFGFYEKTGINLSGEANSIIHQNPTDTDRAVAAFGQRLQVTGIQMANAYCAVANGGELLVPNIVSEITDSEGNVIKKNEKTVKRRVMSENNSKELLSMLESVVAEGTGKGAYIAGYRVAGKTGTSETLETESSDRYVASFVGIAPVDDPKVVVLVLMDHPNQSIIEAAGGTQAAPAAGEIIERTLEYMGVERRYTDAEQAGFLDCEWVPYIIDRSYAAGAQELQANGFKFRVVGELDPEDPAHTKIIGATPQSAYINKNSVITMYVGEEMPEKIEQVTVPDLHGMSVADAYVALRELNLAMKCYTPGRVIAMDATPGTTVDIGTVITLTTNGG